jgi:hypothetical protein
VPHANNACRLALVAMDVCADSGFIETMLLAGRFQGSVFANFNSVF